VAGSGGQCPGLDLVEYLRRCPAVQPAVFALPGDLAAPVQRRGLYFGQGGELPALPPRVTDIWHLTLDPGLVLGFPSPRRVDQHAVVHRELGIGPVQLRVVEVRLVHPSLQVVRDQTSRTTREERERLDMAGRPRGLVQADHRPHEHVPGVRQDHDECPDPLRTPIARIRPGTQQPVVDLRFQPRLRVAPQHRHLLPHRVLGQVRHDIPLERGHRAGHPVLIAQPLMNRRLGHPSPQQLHDVLTVLVEVRPGYLPQPGIGQMREPLLDQPRPIRLAHRWPAGHEPRPRPRP
jgi:hypothetical protein